MYRKVRVRTALSNDRARLFIAAKAVFGSHPTWRDERTLGVLEDDTVFLAEVDEGLAGFVALQHQPPVVEIDRLLVCAGHENEEVETQLLAYAEGYAISSRADALRVVVERENRGARSLYQRAGFVPCGEELLERRLPSVR